MTKPIEVARDCECAPKKLSVREAVAQLKAIVAETQDDEAKRKQYFGYFETSEGDL